MARRKRRSDFEDDGRVIAPMNVEGMPWYARRPRSSGGGGAELSREERRAVYWGVTKAALLVAGVFIAALLGFILFCIHVWFR
jgi:hypothetical protein